jgi:hypothetical protein
LTLARRILPGWVCRVPYENGVELTIEWFRKVAAEVDSKTPTRRIASKSTSVPAVLLR